MTRLVNRLFRGAFFCTIFFLPIALLAQVVRPAPNFTWYHAPGSSATCLADLHQRSVILIITPHGKNLAFLSQLREIQGVYQSLAANKILAFIAFSQTLGRVSSNVPFIIVANGPQVATTYGLSYDKFAIAIIGRDGNLDYFSTKVVSGQRILDIMDNSFAVQTALRRD